jgi:hypothetical protein
VQGFLILIQPSSDPDLFPDESFYFPGIGQAIRGSMEQLFQKKTVLLLGNFPSEGADILLRLPLRAVLSLVTVLTLLRILLLRLASSFLGATRIDSPNDNRAIQGGSCERNSWGVHCVTSYRVVGDSFAAPGRSFEATIPMFVLR